jgi:hypothetical protein
MGQRMFSVQSSDRPRGENTALSNYYIKYNTFNIIFMKILFVCPRYIIIKNYLAEGFQDGG